MSKGLSKVNDAVSTTGIDPPAINVNRWEAPKFQMNADGSYEDVILRTTH
jgi:hypothetical protein